MDEKIPLDIFLKDFLQIDFNNFEIYERAFTHSSYNHMRNYQRLEFLGDAVINLVISDYLYNSYPEKDEGTLSRERASYVRKEVLAMISKELRLNNFIKLGRGEELDGGREKISLLSDLFESFLGALYLDKGFLYTKEWVLKKLNLFEKFRYTVKDYKSILQEKLQKKGILPAYELAGEEGESHDRRYTIEIFIEGERISQAVGKNKKLAEQEAAKLALKKMFPDEEF